MSGRNHASALVNPLGAVPSEAERAMAQLGAWCMFGVGNVGNRIEIRA